MFPNTSVIRKGKAACAAGLRRTRTQLSRAVNGFACGRRSSFVLFCSHRPRTAATRVESGFERTPMSENDPVDGLRQVQESIRRAASDYERDPSSITLVAVSKTFPAESIEPVLGAGQRVFGENYVQEAKAKWPALRECYADVELHMIGPLQSNKAREAVELFDVIHTLDRPSLAEALAKEMARSGRKLRLLMQVNTGEEPQKGGVVPTEVD